jgi:outer membrane protein assembly factor BamB
MLHALHAETGQSLWAEQVGASNHPTLPAAVSSKYVAVVNGSSLYVLSRFNGKLLWKTRLEHVPGAGAGLSERHVYVPMTNGLVYAYRLEPAENPAEQLRKEQKVELTAEEKEAIEAQNLEGIRISQEKTPPLVCTSFGQVLVRPLVTRQTEALENVAWTTSRGMLFVGEVDAEGEHFISRYHLVTNGPMTTEPAYLPADVNVVGDSGVIYGASEDGFVYAVRETDGELLWRFSTGDPIIERAVVAGLRVYVPTQTEGMYCLDAKTGQQVWWAPHIRRFIAASKQRIYTADKVGRVVVLNANSGARLDTVYLGPRSILMTNDWNDRIYVASPTGLVQCLREIELSQPVVHRQTVTAIQKQAAEKQATPASKEKTEKVQEQVEQPDADNPFAPPRE